MESSCFVDIHSLSKLPGIATLIKKIEYICHMKYFHLLLLRPAILCAIYFTSVYSVSFAQIKSKEEYNSSRLGLMRSEESMKLSYRLNFSIDEENAEAYLMKLKAEEIKRTGSQFPPAHNFLTIKPIIDASPLLPVFKKMPKGAILHAHPGAVGDFHWLIQYATYLPNCFLYTGKDSTNEVSGAMRFFSSPPSEDWKSIAALRAASGDAIRFDKELYESITLGTEDLGKPDIWAEFEKCFSRIDGLQSYEAVYSEWNKRELMVIADENVQLLELRSFLGGPTGYDQQGKGPDTAIYMYQNFVNQIRDKHRDFQVRLIFTRMKQTGGPELTASLQEALRLREKYPKWIAGFDLVGEEDALPDLSTCVEQFISIEKEARKRGVSLPYYFHAGESNWTNNSDIVDALMLRSKRIGHGLALIKHPRLMERVRDRRIAIEVCPVSNQVLGYVSDLRNHPAINWIRSGLPVTLNPDDPGMMGYTFSYDFYEAFMAWDLDLADLKMLAINSIKYSSLEEVEKIVTMEKWKEKWDQFIRELNEEAKKN